MRGPARVRGASQEAHPLCHDAVVGTPEGYLPALLVSGRRVGHHRQVDVVQRTETYELRLPSQKLDLPRTPQLVTVLYVDILLGRHGHERDASREVSQDAGRLEPDGHTQHHADLGMVPAGVGRSSLRVLERVPRDPQRVQLAHDPDRRARRAALQGRLQAGQGDTLLVPDAVAAEAVRDQAGGLPLQEPGLRAPEDGLGRADQIVPVTIDLAAHHLL